MVRLRSDPMQHSSCNVLSHVHPVSSDLTATQAMGLTDTAANLSHSKALVLLLIHCFPPWAEAAVNNAVSTSMHMRPKLPGCLVDLGFAVIKALGSQSSLTLMQTLFSNTVWVQ